ncbi:hypothetical protein LOTGIDRAFT_135243 [Lottia gigantea]|uniref:Calcium channel flower n=1 Tax=Lottia gigantea TaxID=225164 RepID=V3ZMQ9_LOTGI|nr:hypothetical protein LOTGIDRAFT_135243 [Lottia gigantea]ESO82121.1 hypothetical protein LOTGIDRAFT_135243 [Lottia gigantea]
MGAAGSRNFPLSSVEQQTLQSQTTTDPNAPTWWFKLLLKGSGVIGGIVAMITGILSCITLTPLCLVAGILMMCIGMFVIMFEAPCCCPWLDFINQISAFSERRPPWQKALLYGPPALLPFFLCISVTTFFGCALIMVCAVLYGMMALGKK